MPTSILVADDSATMRRILQMTFAGEDATVTAVESGQAAIEEAAKLKPDIIFADASMDGVDGYEVARTIKNNPALAHTPIILLASQHHPYDEARGRSAGVDDHISKPFDTQTIIDRVGRMRRLSQPAPAMNPAPTAGIADTHTLGTPKSSLGRAPNLAAAPASPAAASTPNRGPSMPKGTVPGVKPIGPNIGAIAPKKIAAPKPEASAKPAGAQTASFGVQPASPKVQRSTMAYDKPKGIVSPPSAAANAASSLKDQAPSSRGDSSPTLIGRRISEKPPAPTSNASQSNVGASSTPSIDPSKLKELGLSPEQVENVLALSKDVVERIVWEVVPQLAETIIREEIKRLTAD